jgi:hypothetical protein
LQAAAGVAIDALAAAGAAELAAMRTVEIGGATGPHAADVNGVYERTDGVKNGKPVFAKKVAGGSEWVLGLWEAPDGLWLVSPRAKIDGNEAAGWAHNVCTGVVHPAVPGTAWSAWDGTDWIVQEAVTVRTTPDLPAIHSSMAAAAAWDVVDGPVRVPSCAGWLYWACRGVVGHLLGV